MDIIHFIEKLWTEIIVILHREWLDLLAILQLLDLTLVLWIGACVCAMLICLIVFLIRRHRKLKHWATQLRSELSVATEELARERLWRRAGGYETGAISEDELKEMLVSLGYLSSEQSAQIKLPCNA